MIAKGGASLLQQEAVQALKRIFITSSNGYNAECSRSRSVNWDGDL